MDTMLFRDRELLPEPENLRRELGPQFIHFDQFTGLVSSAPYNLALNWNYYNDGKAWLCKVCHKKKTVFWLSVWNVGLRVVFYFTEKDMEAIMNLPISEATKDEFANGQRFGKLIPLIFHAFDTSRFAEVEAVIRYKLSKK